MGVRNVRNDNQMVDIISSAYCFYSLQSPCTICIWCQCKLPQGISKHLVVTFGILLLVAILLTEIELIRTISSFPSGSSVSDSHKPEALGSV